MSVRLANRCKPPPEPGQYNKRLCGDGVSRVMTKGPLSAWLVMLPLGPVIDSVRLAAVMVASRSAASGESSTAMTKLNSSMSSCLSAN
ncbi:hypothetical protein D3C84_1172760 [compost metagenome]